jgi:gas vesicle protein
MDIIMHNRYGETTLPLFVEILQNECYDAIEKACEAAEQQAHKLSNLEIQQNTSNYTSTCQKIIGEIKTHIAERKQKFIPYIQTLTEKVATNHNCSACTGNCKLNHDMQLFELKGSHMAVRSLLNRLQMVSLPLYSETIYPDSYRILRNHMALIENHIAELLLLEEKYLIPKVAAAQKQINAGS